jgi:hypothetical protein
MEDKQDNYIEITFINKFTLYFRLNRLTKETTIHSLLVVCNVDVDIHQTLFCLSL